MYDNFANGAFAISVKFLVTMFRTLTPSLNLKNTKGAISIENSGGTHTSIIEDESGFVVIKSISGFPNDDKFTLS